jgi:hypothetical protein
MNAIATGAIRNRRTAVIDAEPPARGSDAGLRAVKAIHTAAWFSIEACMVYVLYAGFARRSDRRAGIAAGVVAAETLIFAGTVSAARSPRSQRTSAPSTARSPTSICPGGSPTACPPSTSH